MISAVVRRPGGGRIEYDLDITYMDIAKRLQGEHGITNIHVTNGTYAPSTDIVVPTTLTGFKYFENSGLLAPTDTILVGVNSDQSMRLIAQKSNNVPTPLESQIQRMEKIFEPLSMQFPSNTLAIVFFNEETPVSFFEGFANVGMGMESLHKWAYGTKPDRRRIEGADFFKLVVGLPLPNDRDPVCYDVTPTEYQPNVQVVDLRGQPFYENNPNALIDGDSRLLFPVPPQLGQYSVFGVQPPSAGNLPTLKS